MEMTEEQKQAFENYADVLDELWELAENKLYDAINELNNSGLLNDLESLRGRGDKKEFLDLHKELYSLTEKVQHVWQDIEEKYNEESEEESED